MISKLVLFLHTLRYVKPVQVYWRVYLKLSKYIPFSVTIKEKVIIRKFQLIPYIVRDTSLVGSQFRFLNEVGSSRLPVMWNESRKSKLWLYNLHYFDYLNQQIMDKDIALGLLHDWIKENQVATGNGWEPYTLSLRIVNWIKFLLRYDLPFEQVHEVHESLFIQSRFLYRHLEYHLLGNHLFKNCVALIYAGSYFQAEEANNWLRKGENIFFQQIDEQVLEDGGHFERSPMYHAIILEDVLDCINLSLSCSVLTESALKGIKVTARRMCCFLRDITHQDNQLPFFNDCALGIAPVPEQLLSYAARLGILKSQETEEGRSHQFSEELSIACKKDFGLYVIDTGTSRIIMDVGKIGPDYLPGHAHCDSLSYELSIFGRRCIVNSGTYEYAGNLRNHFRSTSSHNTVQIDHEEQHEIWSTFRVARRGYPCDVQIKEVENTITVSASHTGYKRLSGSPAHRRLISINNQESYSITDLIEGVGVHHAVSYIHLHPDVNLISIKKTEVKCQISDYAFTLKSLHDDRITIEKGWYSERFGEKKEITVLTLSKNAQCPFSMAYLICLGEH